MCFDLDLTKFGSNVLFGQMLCLVKGGLEVDSLGYVVKNFAIFCMPTLHWNGT